MFAGFCIFFEIVEINWYGRLSSYDSTLITPFILTRHFNPSLNFLVDMHRCGGCEALPKGESSWII